MQDRVGFPSINTVQAPHWPSPQPYLLPVKSRSSRKTLSRLLSASASMRRLLPFTLISLILSIGAPPCLVGLTRPAELAGRYLRGRAVIVHFTLLLPNGTILTGKIEKAL